MNMKMDIPRYAVWLANKVALIFHDSQNGSRCEFESVHVEAHKKSQAAYVFVNIYSAILTN
jgi:hypothetical protein